MWPSRSGCRPWRSAASPLRCTSRSRWRRPRSRAAIPPSRWRTTRRRACGRASRRRRPARLRARHTWGVRRVARGGGDRVAAVGMEYACCRVRLHRRPRALCRVAAAARRRGAAWPRRARVRDLAAGGRRARVRGGARDARPRRDGRVRSPRRGVLRLPRQPPSDRRRARVLAPCVAGRPRPHGAMDRRGWRRS